MSSEKNPFDNLPGFKETIARIAQVPLQNAPKLEETEIVYPVRDETNGITYRIISNRKLTPSDIRRALSRAFSKTDAWPNESGEAEIRI